MPETSEKSLTPTLSVAGQIRPEEVAELAARGFRALINNRPDGESPDQPSSDEIEAAAREAGLEYVHQPVVSGQVTDEDVARFHEWLNRQQGPVFAFCRTGTRCTHLWALGRAGDTDPEELISTAGQAGYDISGLRDRLEARAAPAVSGDHQARQGEASAHHEVVIVGAGAAGCAVAASLLRRRPELDIAIIEPDENHYYQPGWTLVGGGIFHQRQTQWDTGSCIPAGVNWIRAAAEAFEPESRKVVLDDGRRLGYQALVVCPGLELHWEAIDGLPETLGRNGVTSNYRFDLAPYTWELVQRMENGRALFTQPPMPIKCAGAPQKAMYLACDHWRRRGVLDRIQVDFCTAGAVLFGVEDFVPPLMEYVRRYNAHLNFQHRLVAVDGPAGKAWFEVTDEQGETRTEERDFDMLHAVPPQRAPAFVRNSPLANEDGWVAVSPRTLRHPHFGNVFSLGDVCGAPNAKTAAAVRKQAPVVAENLLRELAGERPVAAYDGYGSCPLIVARGKVVLAEFGYGGKLLPTFPLDPTRPSWLAWKLKASWMPAIYSRLMLRGHEWLARPGELDEESAAQEVEPACDYTAPGGD